MNLNRKTGLAVALVTALAAPSAHAVTFLQDWILDLDGDGDLADAETVTINEFIDITGANLVDLTQTAGVDPNPVYDFEAHGVFNSTGQDGTTIGWPPGSLANEVTLIFEGAGTVVLDDAFDYTSGTLEIWLDTAPDFGTDTDGAPGEIFGANTGTLLASLSLITGDGDVDPTGTPNGTATLEFSVDSMLAGYFYDDMGTDLSTLAGLLPPVLFGFSTTNASLITNPSAVLVDELADEFAGTGWVANINPDGFLDTAKLLLSTNGQFRFAIPEPAPLALMGLGLIGLAGLRRKAAK